MVLDSYFVLINKRKVILCFAFLLSSSLAFSQWLQNDYFTYESSSTEVNAKEIKIYVKSENILSVAGIHHQESKLKIYNRKEEEVFATHFRGTGLNEIRLPKLSSGIYFVRLETESGKMNKKIVLL